MDKIREIMMRVGRQDYRNFYFFIISNLNWARYEESIEFLVSFIPRESKVLELGCGCGHTTAMLALARKDIKIIGTDIEKAETWDYFREFGCLFKETDATEIPFNSEEFDVVISFGVLEHVKDKKDENKFLKEVYRCLKKDGHNIMFNLPNRYSLSEYVCRKFNITTHHQRLYSAKEIISLLRNNGFEIKDFQREHLIPAQVDRMSSNLGNLFNKVYPSLFKLDHLICRFPLSIFCQDFRIISQKSDFLCYKI